MIMTRYFERFLVGEPMREVSEAEAGAAFSHVVEADVGEVRRLALVIEGQLDRIIYPDAVPSPRLAEIQRVHDVGVPGWVVSPVVREGDVARYTVWSYQPSGVLEKRVEHVDGPRIALSTWYHPDGRLGGSMERHYDESGEMIEAIATDESGNRVVVHD